MDPNVPYMVLFIYSRVTVEPILRGGSLGLEPPEPGNVPFRNSEDVRQTKVPDLSTGATVSCLLQGCPEDKRLTHRSEVKGNRMPSLRYFTYKQSLD